MRSMEKRTSDVGEHSQIQMCNYFLFKKDAVPVNGSKICPVFSSPWLWFSGSHRPCWLSPAYAIAADFFLGLRFGASGFSLEEAWASGIWKLLALGSWSPALGLNPAGSWWHWLLVACGTNRIQMPSCFHSLKQMCFPDGLHKGFVSSFVDEWWWWYLEEYY